MLASAAIAHPKMAAAPTQIRKSLQRPATPSARPGTNVADRSNRRQPGRVGPDAAALRIGRRKECDAGGADERAG